jgi:hypothetical protein
MDRQRRGLLALVACAAALPLSPVLAQSRTRTPPPRATPARRDQPVRVIAPNGRVWERATPAPLAPDREREAKGGAGDSSKDGGKDSEKVGEKTGTKDAAGQTAAEPRRDSRKEERSGPAGSMPRVSDAPVTSG